MSQTLSPEEIVDHHTRAVQDGDLDEILKDYTDESVIISQTAVFRGLDELRVFFTEILSIVPEGFWDAYTVTRQVVAGEILYDVWEAKPWFPLGTDTLLIRDGKILVQTGTMLAAAPED